MFSLWREVRMSHITLHQLVSPYVVSRQRVPVLDWHKSPNVRNYTDRFRGWRCGAYSNEPRLSFQIHFINVAPQAKFLRFLSWRTSHHVAPT
jgi:hypothetical protein